MVPGSHTWGDDEPERDGTGGTRGIPSAGITGSLADIGALNQDGSFSPPPDALIQDVKAVPRPVLKGECHFREQSPPIKCRRDVTCATSLTRRLKLPQIMG